MQISVLMHGAAALHGFTVARKSYVLASVLHGYTVYLKSESYLLWWLGLDLFFFVSLFYPRKPFTSCLLGLFAKIIPP